MGAILDNMVMEGLCEGVPLSRNLDVVKEKPLWLSGVGMVQAERTAHREIQT